MSLEFDKDFIEKLVKQDQWAFNEFYLKTVDMFFRYIQSNYYLSKQATEDIISDFYVKWREVVKKYDNKQSFTAFMRTVFKNLLKDNFKKHKDISFSSFDNSEEGINFDEKLEDDFDIFDLLETDFKYEQIKLAMQLLGEEDREIIYLKFIEENSNADIANILGITNDNVRQKVSRAIKKLKSLLNTDIT